jgi:hypothetical protein
MVGGAPIITSMSVNRRAPRNAAAKAEADQRLPISFPRPDGQQHLPQVAAAFGEHVLVPAWRVGVLGHGEHAGLGKVAQPHGQHRVGDAEPVAEFLVPPHAGHDGQPDDGQVPFVRQPRPGERNRHVVHQPVARVDHAVVQVGRGGGVVEEQQLTCVIVDLGVGRDARLVRKRAAPGARAIEERALIQ